MAAQLRALEQEDGMDPLTEIQRELNHVACPHCQKSRFDLTLRCDLSYKECLYTATCLACGSTFTISAETNNLPKTSPDIKKTHSEQHCCSCGQVGVELIFRCDLNQRACFYVTACRHCAELSHQRQ